MSDTEMYAPGSRMHAAQLAQEAAQPPQEAPAADPGSGISPLPVRQIGADSATPSTKFLNPSGNGQMLGQNSRRRRAVIIAIDNPVVICASPEAAQNATNFGAAATVVPAAGFYLPVGIPLPIEHRAAVYAANTSTTQASRISVLSEYDEAPDPFTLG